MALTVESSCDQRVPLAPKVMKWMARLEKGDCQTPLATKSLSAKSPDPAPAGFVLILKTVAVLVGQ